MKQITLSLIALVLFASNLTGQETKAVDLMSKALYEENISADYAKASLIYQQVLKDFSQDKKACGQATYRLGLCAEKLGQVKAQEYFISVVENFSDQPELVNLARAKLNNSVGTKYFTDERDGKKYKYVTIGRQVWMAENLAYMPHVNPGEVQGGIWVYGYHGKSVTEAQQTDNYQKYGCLYDFETARKSCPAGWHLPSNNEWVTLERFLGFEDLETNQNKSSITKNISPYTIILKPDDSPGYWDNLTGLSLAGGGWRESPSRNPQSYFTYPLMVRGGYYWSTTQVMNNDAWCRFFPGGSSRVIKDQQMGMSVRCVKDFNDLKPVEAHPSEIKGRINGEKVIGLNSFIVTTAKNDLVDSVKLFIRNGQEFQLVGTDYSNLMSTPIRPQKAYELGWNTRQYHDGIYSLSVITYHFGGHQDTTGIQLEVANNYPTKKDGEFVDSRDGKEYPYVNIGKQSWMAKNLDYLLDEGSGSFCYNDMVTNCITYGRLYTHKTALKACPAGWHLPSNEEWLELEISLGMDTTMLSDGRYYHLDKTGQKVKSEIGWQNQLNITTKEMVNGAGTNESGLNILPGGYLKGNFGYSNRGDYTSLWTSSVDEKFRPQYRSVQSWPQCIDRDYDREGQEANYVRCIKDTPPTKN